MKLFNVVAILFVLLMATILMVPMVAAPSDNINHVGADNNKTDLSGNDKDNPNNNRGDKDKQNCGIDKEKNCVDQRNRDKNPAPIKYATLAAMDLVRKISTQSGDFAEWNGATVVKNTAYYDLTGTESAYSFDVMANGQYNGYVMVSASRDNYPILEFSKGITPDKDPATLLHAKRLVQSRITNRKEIIGEGQPVYLGATFFEMAYPLQSNTMGSGPQQISSNWILVDLIEGNIANPANEQLNASEKKERELNRQVKIAEANAAWDTIEKSAGSGPDPARAASPIRGNAAAAESPAVQASPSNRVVVIGGVPPYTWRYGCSPTAAAMIVGYWENRGLTGLPAVTDTVSGNPLNLDLATEMGTTIRGDGSPWLCLNPFDTDCGVTDEIRISPGINSVLKQSGIKPGNGWRSRLYRDNSFNTDAMEIDNGYPFVLSIFGGGTADGSTGTYGDHSVAVIGYDKTDPKNPRLIIYDTWDTHQHYIAYNNWQRANDDRIEPVRKYTITARAGTGGTITPSGSVTVLPYFSQPFTITPDPGYVIDDVLVDIDHKGAVGTYTFPAVWRNHTISAAFKRTPSPASAGWNWATRGWGDWKHTWSVSGRQVGPNSEYGPVMVTDPGEGTHGEHGTNNNLLAGSTQSGISKTFTDPSGKGWNTITFKGLLTATTAPDGRWLTIDVNGNTLFGGRATQMPPGNGVPFEIRKTFAQSSSVTVTITNGQNPAWGPRFAMHYYSVALSREDAKTPLAKTGGIPFIIPDDGGLVTNGTPTDTSVTT